MFVNAMKKYGLSVISVIWIAGCATASKPPNPLANVPNLSEKNLGQVVSVAFSGMPIVSDETKNIQHWQTLASRRSPDRANMVGAFDLELGNFDKYCSSIGGKLVHPVPRDRRVLAQVVCEQGNADKSIFLISAHTSAPDCRNTQPGEFGYDSYYLYSCSVWVDAFRWKSPGPLSDFDREYRFGTVNNGYFTGEGYVTAQAANAQGKMLQAENSRKAAEIMAEFNRRKKLQQDSELQEKTVGQKICRHVTATQRKVIGSAMNEPVYGAPTELYAKVTGFTEQLSADKIQIRISGIQANGENLNRIDGDVVIETGAVIWDNPKNWGLCD